MVLGLLIFTLGIYYLGRQQSMFSSSITIKTRFDNAKGLREGSNVRFAGIQIGRVTNINLLSDSVVQVEMAVEQNIVKFIRKDSKVEIVTEGVMGNKLLEINPGSSKQAMVKEGDVLPSKKSLDVDDIINEVGILTSKTKSVISNIDQITRKINEGEGNLGKLIHDTSLIQKINMATSDIQAFTGNLNQVSYKINHGEGLLATLINDKSMSRDMEKSIAQLDDVMNNLGNFSRGLEDFAENMNNGAGLVNKLVYDTSTAVKIDTTITRINESISEVTETAKALNNSWLINLFSKKINGEIKTEESP